MKSANPIVRFFSTHLMLKGVSVVIAIVLWAIALGSRVVEENIEVPVEILTAADIVPANEIPDQVVFRVSGPKAFLRGMLERKEQPIRVNLTTEKPRIVPVRFSADNIRLPLGVKVLSINPSGVLVKLETVKRREVPVRLELRGSPADGFKITKTELSPEFVRVKGPETRVDQLAEISTVPVQLTDASRSIDREVEIHLSRFNVQLDGPIPRVKIQIEPESANFRVRNADVRVLPVGKKARVDVKRVTILLRAEPAEIRALDRSKVFGRVDLKGLAPGRHQVEIQGVAPVGMGVVKVIPETTDVVIDP